jgi:hypothetical protein
MTLVLFLFQFVCILINLGANTDEVSELTGEFMFIRKLNILYGFNMMRKMKMKNLQCEKILVK